MALVWATAGRADLRIATWNADLSRDGPGLLLRDILSGKDPVVEQVIQGLVQVRPDILLLTRFDHDLDGVALSALTDRLRAVGLDYPHRHAPAQNRGLPSGLDLDGNGRLGDPDDAQGYGRFSGDGAMALLSRWPVVGVADHSGFLWADLPGARIVHVPPPARAHQRLSSSGHWILAVQMPQGPPLHLLAWAATPPLYGARNPDRNHDEAAFWLHLLDGRLPTPPPSRPLVLIGLPNLAPGQGDPAALRALARHPALQLPAHPPSATLVAGPAALSLLQPSADLRVTSTGLHPDPGPHRLIWLDLVLDPAPP